MDEGRLSVDSLDSLNPPTYLLETVGEVLRLIEPEGLIRDERRADGVDPLQDLLQVPVSLERRQAEL